MSTTPNFPSVETNKVYRLRLRTVRIVPLNNLTNDNNEDDPFYVVHAPPSNDPDSPAFTKDGLSYIATKSNIEARYLLTPDGRAVSRYFMFDIEGEGNSLDALDVTGSVLSEKSGEEYPGYEATRLSYEWEPDIREKLGSEYVETAPGDGIQAYRIGRHTILVDTTDRSALLIFTPGSKTPMVMNFQIGHSFFKGVTGFTVEQILAALQIHISKGPLSTEMAEPMAHIAAALAFFDPENFKFPDIREENPSKKEGE